MIHVLFRFLPLLFFPVGLSCLLGAAALAGLLRGARRAAILCLSAALAILYLCSIHPVAWLLLHGLESRYAQQASYPKCPAIVILGGAGVPANPPRLHPETNAYGDRVLYGAMLYHQGFAEKIVVTGGSIPFINDFDGTEAGINAALLREYFGIDSSALILAENSMNTYEDALSTARQLEKSGLAKDVLLVTSAAHMPRSVGVFRKQGFTVHPAPTDFHAETALHVNVWGLFPQEGFLNETCFALHEYVGLLTYRLLGWT
jgi:uncharacterized SAM-binding protein YcdF (DUF218 family)